MSRSSRSSRLQHMRTMRRNQTQQCTHHRILTTLMTLPIRFDELTEVIDLIPIALDDDEAGPAFFLATETWITTHQYQELPF